LAVDGPVSTHAIISSDVEANLNVKRLLIETGVAQRSLAGITGDRNNLLLQFLFPTANTLKYDHGTRITILIEGRLLIQRRMSS